MIKDCSQLYTDLLKIQNKINCGKGIDCVNTILFFLSKDDVHKARVVAENEHDKISVYPELLNYLQEYIGIV